MNRTPLTDELANQIGGALHRLEEIGSSKIISPTHEAEQKGLVQFLQRVLLEHANELLGSWFVAHREYEPLVHSFAALLNRATIAIQRAQQRQQPAEPKNTDGCETSPSNVVPLNQ